MANLEEYTLSSDEDIGNENTGLLGTGSSSINNNNNRNNNTGSTKKHSNDRYKSSYVSKNDYSINGGGGHRDLDGANEINNEQPFKEKVIHFMKRVFVPEGEMPQHDRINMDWLQKWRVYNRFPWKLLIHLVLTICLSSIIFIQTGDLTEYTVGIEATWYKVFFPSDFEYEGDYGSNLIYFYNIQDVLDLIQSDLEAYNQLSNSSVNKISIVSDTLDPPYNASLVISSYVNCQQVFDTSIVKANTHTHSVTYSINSEDLGPLSLDRVEYSDLQELFYCMSSLYVEFTLSNIHLQYDHPVNYEWSVKLYFDNTIQSGRIQGSLISTKSRMSDVPYSKLLQSSKMIIDGIIILFSILSQVLAWRSFMFSFRTFQKTKKLVYRNSSLQFQAKTINWNSLPMRMKIRFFNLWFIICFVCNICTIVGAILDFFESGGSTTATVTKLTLGFGTLLSWINLIRYLEFDRKSTALIRALGTGLPTILRFSAGSLPIFIGFALFGLIYFSESSSRFSTFGEASVTLFGLQNGDDIQATFRATEKNWIVSKIYFFVFVFISMYAIANIYIAIMEASYSQSVGIKSKAQRNADENKDNGNSDELNLDDELWNTLLGLRDSDYDSQSDGYDDDDDNNNNNNNNQRRKKKRIGGGGGKSQQPPQRRMKVKFPTNKKLTESQILSTDRAINTLDMDKLVEDISKSILEKQISFNRELQTLIKNSIHQRIEDLVQSQQLSVINQQQQQQQQQPNPNNNNNNQNNNNNSNSTNDNNNSTNNVENIINIHTDQSE